MVAKKEVKVLYIVESFSTGVYAIARDIACNLDRDRFTVHILHSLREDSPTTIEKDFNQNNITLSYIPMGSLKTYPSAVKAIREHIRTFSPDVIHLHSSKAGVLGRLAVQRKAETPVLYSPHGFSFLREDVGAVKRWLFLAIEKMIQQWRPARIIAVSDGEAVHARSITSEVTTINNFICTEQFTAHQDREGTYIVTCGRISPQKNPILFNEIAQKTPREQFMWIGDGPLRDQLTAANITVTGLLPRTEAMRKVMEAKFYIQTSLWEGMPVSILEAMAAGKAVVATDIVGNRDLIKNGTTGLLCDPHSSKECVRHIETLCASQDLRRVYGEAAAGYVQAHHSLKGAIKSYESLYRKR